MQIIHGSFTLLLACVVSISCTESKSEKPGGQPPEPPASGTMKFSDGVEVEINRMKENATCIKLVEQLKEHPDFQSSGDVAKGVRIQIQDDADQNDTFYCMM